MVLGHFRAHDEGVRVTRFSLACLGLALSACECDDGLGALQGVVEATPDPLDFGDVPVGAEKTLRLSLRNTGTFLLRIQTFEATGPFLAPTSSATIAAGGLLEVSIAFRPPAIGAQTGKLTITTDATENAITEVDLVGNGIEAAIVVDPLVVDFGEVLWVTTTQPERRTVTVSNPGTDAFELTAIDLTDDGGGGFGVEPGTLVGSFGPEASRTFEVTFMPNQMGAVTGTVQLQTTAPNSAEVLVTLRATAVGPELEVCGGVTGGAELCTDQGQTPAVNFDSVDFNTSHTGRIVVKNAGNRELSVQGEASGTIESFAFSPTIAEVSTFVLAPSEERVINVSYTAADYQIDTSFVGFGTNSATRQNAVVRVEARINRAIVEVVPRSLTFSLEGASNRGEVDVQVFNCGQSMLIFPTQPIVRQTSGAGSVFSLQNPPAAATSLAPQACAGEPGGARFQVVFQPTQNGNFEGEVVIQTNDPIDSEVLVDVAAVKR
jgi:hypothetical protein